MAGYMTKLVGSDGIYDGSYKAGEVLTNGIFVNIAADGTVKKLTGAGSIEMRVREKTTLWGLPAVILDVVLEGDGTAYFVEQVEPGVREEWNDIANEIKIGEFVRMHKPLLGEQLIMSVTSEVLATLAEGDTAKPAAGGTIAKKSA